jgi:hypothetical protein
VSPRIGLPLGLLTVVLPAITVIGIMIRHDQKTKGYGPPPGRESLLRRLPTTLPFIGVGVVALSAISRGDTGEHPFWLYIAWAVVGFAARSSPPSFCLVAG